MGRIGDSIERSIEDIPIERSDIGDYHTKPRVPACRITGLCVQLIGQKIVGICIPQTEKRICVGCITINQASFNLVFLAIANLDFEHSGTCLQIAGVFDKTIKLYHNFCALGSDVMTDALTLENRHFVNQNDQPI